jgi:hypothetical protein
MKSFLTWLCLIIVCINHLKANPKVSSTLIITQVYGDGGTTGSTYANDFIEIFNNGNTAINLTNYSIQYSTGTSWVLTQLTAVILQPGKYYLIKEASNGSGGMLLPYADVSGTISLHANNGKVALVNSISPLPNGCSSSLIIDLVGYGNANCSEGAAATGGSNMLSIMRNTSNTDTDNNYIDFTLATPNPRTSAFTLPIIINNFTSYKKDNANELRWQISCLTSSVTFELQRSPDVTKFKTLYSETASRARCADAFTFTDGKPLSETNFYRLKVTSDNQIISFSKILTIVNNDNQPKKLSINPTIVNNGASIKLISNAPQNIYWIITDMQGRQIKKFSSVVSDGENNIPLNTNQLPTGQYQLNGYSTLGKTMAAKFVKQ